VHHREPIAIVEAIVNLAKNLGMKVVAEWAEDLATMKTLSEIGVDYVQGFVIARPQHPDKFLMARSSASFIENTEVAAYVAKQEKFDAESPMADHSPPTADSRLH
jgi:EAL domain-containing protein (putative c-di-GMP-specific phosphodiesterase class I)